VPKDPTKEDADAFRALMNQKVDFKVTISGITDLPEGYNNIFCKYKFWGEEVRTEASVFIALLPCVFLPLNFFLFPHSKQTNRSTQRR
jgi:hypothetical protein